MICQVARGTRGRRRSRRAGGTEGISRRGGTSRLTRRRDLLHAIADGIERRADDIAVLESWDSGQPIRFMSKAALRGAENFRFYADRAESARDGVALPTDTHLNYTARTPIGPVGVITPWNTPFMLSTWKIAPALAAGCTVVHKPAEWSPVTAQLLAGIALEAGLPPGVLNVVHGFGEEAGRALTEHESIRAIAFVGESATGAAIMRQGSATLKRVHFELGGKNPVIVFEDADLERALDAVIFMIYSLNGERCTSSSRLLVQASIAEDFTERLTARVRGLRVGHPLDPRTEVGPLIHERHREKVHVLLRDRARRGRADRGGRRGRGWPRRRTLRRADTLHQRASGDADRAGGDLRPGADCDPVCRRAGRRSDRERRAHTGSRRICGPATSAARFGYPSGWRPG